MQQCVNERLWSRDNVMIIVFNVIKYEYNSQPGLQYNNTDY